MSYWIFKANPEQYRIDDRLKDPNPDITWAVTRYHDRIQKGDTVFVWRGGMPRGICAVMQVEACPYQPSENDLQDGYELPARNSAPAVEHWAKCQIIQRFPLIEMGVVKKIPGLELFSFFSAFQQATNFTVTRPEGSILLEFIKSYKAPEPEKKSGSTPSKSASRLQGPSPVRTAGPTRIPGTGKSVRPVAAPVSKAVQATLLKCGECGRFVVSTETERHEREAHDGDATIQWKKVK